MGVLRGLVLWGGAEGTSVVGGGAEGTSVVWGVLRGLVLCGRC